MSDPLVMTYWRYVSADKLKSWQLETGISPQENWPHPGCPLVYWPSPYSVRDDQGERFRSCLKDESGLNLEVPDLVWKTWLAGENHQALPWNLRTSEQFAAHRTVKQINKFYQDMFMEFTGVNPQVGVPPNLWFADRPNFIDSTNFFTKLNEGTSEAYVDMAIHMKDGKVQIKSMYGEWDQL